MHHNSQKPESLPVRVPAAFSFGSQVEFWNAMEFEAGMFQKKEVRVK
jgi:hypothetical protein